MGKNLSVKAIFIVILLASEFFLFACIKENKGTETKVIIRACDKNEFYKICFSPEGNCKELLLAMVGKAKRSVRIMIYSFTLSELANELIKKHKDQNVIVQVIFDAGQAKNKYSVDEMLANAGIEVKYDARNGLQHNKVLIVDDSVVCLGSFNFSKSANYRNRENLLCTNNKQVVSAYVQNFWKNWNEIS